VNEDSLCMGCVKEVGMEQVSPMAVSVCWDKVQCGSFKDQEVMWCCGVVHCELERMGEAWGADGRKSGVCHHCVVC
jgi:hypothetical protein